MIGRPRVKILVDASTLILGVTHVSRWVDTGQKLWGGKIPVNTGFLGRFAKTRRLDERFLINEQSHLPAVAELARDRQISLCTTGAIQLEVQRGNASEGLMRGAHQMLTVPAPPPEWGTEASLLAFQGDRSFLRFRVLQNSPNAAVRFHLSQRYSELGKYMGYRHRRDRYHLLCTEALKCDAFLTVDKKLRNLLYSQTNKLDLGFRVLFPSELATEFGKVGVDIDEYADRRNPWFFRTIRGNATA